MFNLKEVVTNTGGLVSSQPVHSNSSNIDHKLIQAFMNSDVTKNSSIQRASNGVVVTTPNIRVHRTSVAVKVILSTRSMVPVYPGRAPRRKLVTTLAR